MRKEFAGLLMIGDPHVSSRRPGRRKDDYLSSVLDKLAACAERANRESLQAVVTGDLLHRNNDNDLGMLSRLVRTLQLFEHPPFVVEGNHDKADARVGDADTLGLLTLTGCVRLVSEPGPFYRGQVGGHDVELFAAPYGSPLPNRLESSAEFALLVSHHDLAIGGQTYPGCTPLHEVVGCVLWVNGHMHKTYPSVPMGGTMVWNPGNIEPLSIDMEHHAPKSWSWTPAKPQWLEGHALPHGTDLFDRTGISVAAADAQVSVQALAPSAPPAAPASEFAAQLQGESSLDAARSDDASMLAEDLASVLQERQAGEAVQALFKLLLADVQAQALAA